MGGGKAANDAGFERTGSVNAVTHRWMVPPGGPFPDDWDRVHRDDERRFNFERTYDLTILLRNLAVAGALCATYDTGTCSARCSRCGERRDEAALRAGFLAVGNGAWFPGCGWEHP